MLLTLLPLLKRVSGPVYPNPADVRLGVRYGPTGIEYTGTLTATGGGGQIWLRRR